MLHALLNPGKGSIDPLALRDPQRFVPTRIRGLFMFPEWIEEKLKPVDDLIIDFIQFFTNPFIFLLARFVSMFFSVEVAAFIPYFYLIVGLDRAFLSVLSQCIVLLVVSQLPKRFMWRFRPYMVNRAKMGSADASSSFPARTVTCSIVFTYITHATYLSYINPFGTTLFIFYMLLTCAYILVPFMASLSRIALGAHYPSDCVVGVLQGLFCCLFGEIFYHSCLSCPKQLIRANELVPWSWSNFDYTRALVFTLVGFFFIIFSGIQAISLWKKIPLIFSYIFPSLVFCSLICTTRFDAPDGGGAYYLTTPVVFVQHYVLVFFSFGIILISYNYLKLKQVDVVAAVYFFVVHISLLVVLMLHRLHIPPPDNEGVMIKDGIGDVDLES